MTPEYGELTFSTRADEKWIYLFAWNGKEESSRVDLGRISRKLFEDSPGSWERFSKLFEQLSADATHAIVGVYPDRMIVRTRPSEGET